ncbi:MAG: ImmA/IrrE family metallo-endopeptidase [Clostridia bacterium]|nr:ImmA/IrrE family metallo-endopeptidase [Clostridia bacterium]
MVVYALINKEVIPYICQRKKVSLDYLQTNAKVDASKLSKWFCMDDPSVPTIPEAKRIAKCLHIPFAGLYMNVDDIPIKSIPAIKNFRTLDAGLMLDDSRLNIAIHDVLSERDYLISALQELERPIPTLSMPVCHGDNAKAWALEIRKHFGIDIREQYKLKSSRQLYLYLRDKIERCGIFVHCFTGVPVEVVRGFSIYEQQLPMIGVNDSDRPPAKAFSLIHELVHLLKRESSVCNIMYNATAAQQEEVFCNAVAGELLVPNNALTIVLESEKYHKPYTLDDIRLIANRFSVSREVIIRRLLDTQRIDVVEYETYASEFRQQLELEKEKQREARAAGQDDIFRRMEYEIINRTSTAVCKTLYFGYCEDIYTKRDIAQHLGVAQKHIDKFLMEVSKWNN